MMGLLFASDLSCYNDSFVEQPALEILETLSSDHQCMVAKYVPCP